ncbi:MAG: ATPase domain-containing protein [Candidatus Nanoarchaeia archaeon]|nr:ATPase domain-containing protein [Candidatus Nanoarchaeia archaeon]MDD5740628.1 ATPase domain-containing protein [Candidatus Nanoarchaeia archaeon]
MVVKKAAKKKPEVVKSASNEERIATGIKNFDSLVEGGFEKNSINLIVGSSGSGKSIFAVEFLIEGIKKGENCLYITFEEGKDEFYANMLEFGWDLAKYEKEGKFFFLEYTPEKVKTMLEEGGGTIESVVLTKNIKRIVIDSITSFELLFEKELEKRESALSLFNMLSKWECTALLTYEGTPSPEKKVTSRVLDFESDSIVLLYFIREKKRRNRYLEVLKMRGTKHSLSIYPFTIEKTGIIVSNQTYEGELK